MWSGGTLWFSPHYAMFLIKSMAFIRILFYVSMIFLFEECSLYILKFGIMKNVDFFCPRQSHTPTTGTVFSQNLQFCTFGPFMKYM